MRGWSLGAQNSVACGSAVEAPQHRVLVRESESDADWQDYPVVQQAQNNSRIDPAKNEAYFHPWLINQIQ